MGELKEKLVFCWNGSHCTHTDAYSLDDEHKKKKIVFKELRRIWEDNDSNHPWEEGTYNESNTLLLDDSPYKGLCNPGLANAEDMRDYIKENPFGQPPITETSKDWHYYLQVLRTLFSESK
ncbi:HAD superfamily [Sesbania bispinosa]|nr:HAD superfamily [Sesbania bispinosa]